jgi:hypothetical protein
MKGISEKVQFSVTLHHLAHRARQAGAGYPDVEISGIHAPDLREILEGLATLAPTVEYPAAPELRIASPHGQFLVQVCDGRIRFSSWALRDGAAELTTDQILAAIGGVEVGAGSTTTLAAQAVLTALAPVRRSKWIGVGLLAAAIVATNSLTAWLLTRPGPDLLPEYHLVHGPPATRLLADVAGDFETGGGSGDRALSIAQDGSIRWVLFGQDRMITEDTLLTAQPARSGGKPALLTSERALIEIRDPVTIVYYGDTYRRKAR